MNEPLGIQNKKELFLHVTGTKLILCIQEYLPARWQHIVQQMWRFVEDWSGVDPSGHMFRSGIYEVIHLACLPRNRKKSEMNLEIPNDVG